MYVNGFRCNWMHLIEDEEFVKYEDVMAYKKIKDEQEALIMEIIKGDDESGIYDGWCTVFY